MRAGSPRMTAAVSLLAVGALAPALASASSGNGLAAPWAHWRGGAPVTLSSSRAGYARGPLPQTIDPGPGGDYADLRLVDGSPLEVPYAIDPADGASPATENLPLSDSGFVRGAYSQVVADAGDSGTTHDAIAIATSRATYFVRGSVEASDDRRVWRELASDATLYRVAEAGDAGNQTIAFPPTRSRWLRVRLADPHDAFPIDAVSLAAASHAPAALVPLDAAVSAKTSPTPGDQRFVLDFGTPHTLVSALRVDGTSGFFSRDVTVESSEDARSWTPAGSGTVQRFAEGGAHLGFAFDETRGRYLRVTVANGNDPALGGLRPVALRRPREIVFAARAGASYGLAFGNAGVSPPVYDLARRLASERWRPSLVARVGPVQIDTTSPADTRSFFERYPWIVTVVFAVVGAGLALFAVQTLRGAPPDPDAAAP